MLLCIDILRLITFFCFKHIFYLKFIIFIFYVVKFISGPTSLLLCLCVYISQIQKKDNRIIILLNCRTY